ncbi:hypothetical protein CHS0354_021286 [Potamilus streckersoni]|uniref:Uncharacterized protein n=1 Tax=Potamilus streckersoni TaxID=2493646 RepID=A0AAE0WGN0_9BIVA|nr:hypothetical protein CHS0354_021286 [Potamilus streckersoni]
MGRHLKCGSCHDVIVRKYGKNSFHLLLRSGQMPTAEQRKFIEKRLPKARFTVFISVCDKSEKLIRKDIHRTMRTDAEQRGHQSPIREDAQTNVLSLKQQSNSVVKEHEDTCNESIITYEKEQFLYFELHVIDGTDTLPDCNTNHRVLEKLKEIFVSPAQSVQNGQNGK